MPKSKRNRPVTLSKTKKKPGLERKGKVVTEIKDAIERYGSAYVFTYDNMRNQKLKDLRDQLKSSSRIWKVRLRILRLLVTSNPFLHLCMGSERTRLSEAIHAFRMRRPVGKLGFPYSSVSLKTDSHLMVNRKQFGLCLVMKLLLSSDGKFANVNSRIFLAGKKVMQIALGRSAADEAKTGLHKLSKFLQGDAGLLFTNLPRDDVERLFREFEEHDFARTGSIATEMVELKEGPLEQFTHEMEPFLRKQGLRVRLNKALAWDADGNIPVVPCLPLVS